MKQCGRVVTQSIEEIRAWRTNEAEAGRPSSFAAYCHQYGYCDACNAEGLVLNDNGIGFKLAGQDGNMPLFELCPVCKGTGKASQK
jgi:hypothetical protein